MVASEAIKAVECLECDALFEDEEDDTIDCPVCDTAGVLQRVVISPCPMIRPADCKSGQHHFGRGDHVTTVER